MGLTASDAQVDEILAKVKQKALEKKWGLTDDEFKAIVDETLKH
jgi:isopropylmalate/homocitrate/citramalate synthase